MADLVVRIVGDDSKLRSGLKSAESSVAKFSGKVSGLGKSVAGGVFGGALLTGGLLALKGQMADVFGEARESAKVGRLTDAVIKSTGGAANVSAGQIGKLADALSNKIGVDDEVIQSSENLLLTFTNVQNKVGEGNDIFSQATATIQDMSAALGTDAKASTIQLGKALNDPIKGITALTRVGVSFTAQQKAQIKALVESGDTLGAQKIILKELGKEFGGAAAAATDPMQKLSVTVANLKEKIGLALLPAVEKVAKWLGENLPRILDKLGKIFGEVFDGAKRFVSDLADTFGTSEGTILKVLAGIAAGLVAIAVAWNLGPGIVITGVVALGAALLYAYNRFEGFRTGVQATMRAVAVAVDASVKVVRGIIVGLQAFWEAWGGRISAFTRGVWDGIKLYISGVLNVISGVIKVVTSLIHGDWSAAWEGIKQILFGVWEGIKGIVTIGLTYITSVLSLGWKFIAAGVSAAWGAILEFFKGLPGKIVAFFSDLPGQILAVFDGAEDWLLDIGGKIIGGLISGIKGKLGDLKDSLTSIPGKIVDWKGPPAKDAVLLKPIGGLVMRGFITGIDDSLPALRAKLGAVSAMVSAQRFVGSAPKIAPAVSPSTTAQRFIGAAKAAPRELPSVAALKFIGAKQQSTASDRARDIQHSERLLGLHVRTLAEIEKSLRTATVAKPVVRSSAARFDTFPTGASSFAPADTRPTVINVTMPIQIDASANADDIIRVIKGRGKAAVAAAVHEYERDHGRPVSARPR